jgi:long-chain acyl-CoA synthetase
MAINTLPKALLNIAQKQPKRIAMRRKDFGIWRDITWSEYLENVKHVALGLNALGVKYKDHVSIIGENRPEWLYSALGAVCAGGAWVGIYTTNPVAECQYVVEPMPFFIYVKMRNNWTRRWLLEIKLLFCVSSSFGKWKA